MTYKLAVSFILAVLLLMVWRNYGHPNESNYMIRIPVFSSNLNLDPHTMEDADSMAINLQLHRGLLRYLPDGTVVPDLVAKWETLEDGKIVRFKLKEAYFSNGSRITSTDVVNSFARLLWTNSSMAADLTYIVGADEFRKSARIEDLGIKINSPAEVEFQLEYRMSLFLKHLAAVDCAVLNLKNFDDKFDPQAINTGFSGPYKLLAYGDRINIEKWRNDFHESKSPPHRVQYELVAPKSLFEKAKKSELDAADNVIVSKENIADLRKLGWRQWVAELTRQRFVVMNPSLVDINVRAYLFKTFDSDKLIASLQEQAYLPAYGLIPTGLQGGLTKNQLEQLKSEMALSAPPSGSVDLFYSNEFPLNYAIVSALKAIWDREDFKVNLRGISTNELLSSMSKGDKPLLFAVKGMDYPDGNAVLTYFRSSSEPNQFHVRDAAIDRSLQELNMVLDPVERIERYQNIQLSILQKLTFIPLMFGSGHAGAWSSRVSFVPPHPMGFQTLPLEMLEVVK